MQKAFLSKSTEKKIGVMCLRRRSVVKRRNAVMSKTASLRVKCSMSLVEQFYMSNIMSVNLGTKANVYYAKGKPVFCVQGIILKLFFFLFEDKILL